MWIRGTLASVGLALLGVGEVVAGPLLFHAHDPGSGSVFDISADLVPKPFPTSPGPAPIQDLSDPTNRLLTQPVQNEALFSFGMAGTGGESFSFAQQDSLLIFKATGSAGSVFKIFFDPHYTDASGTHSPFKSVLIPGNPVIPGNPIFPQGTFSIDYTLAQDPPFTVGISILDAAGENLTFSSVPEPASLTILASGAVLLGGSIRRRRHAVTRRGRQ